MATFEVSALNENFDGETLHAEHPHHILVGYVNDTIDQYGSNASMITPQFIGMGADGEIDLSTIKCPDSAYGEIFLQQLYGDGYLSGCSRQLVSCR